MDGSSLVELFANESTVVKSTDSGAGDPGFKSWLCLRRFFNTTAP